MSEEEAGGDHHIDIEHVDPLPLEEAFAIVGEETRADIVVALGEARNSTDPTPDVLGFSELMERVGVEDSGRFNYHLDKLVGPFVKKTDEGYTLRLPGQLVYQAVVAGTLTERERIDPFPVGPCPDCGGQLSAAYHPDHILTVECDDCGTLYDAVHLPKRGIEDRTGEALLDAAYKRRHSKLGTMRRGVCHSCAGRVARSLEREASVAYAGSTEEMDGLDVYAVMACEACNASLVGNPAAVALTTPAVVGFFADHGLDVAVARWWEDPLTIAKGTAQVLTEDPPSVAVPFEAGDERLRVVLDDCLQVVDAERTDTVGRKP